MADQYLAIDAEVDLGREVGGDVAGDVFEEDPFRGTFPDNPGDV